jgi:hypothetical protein
VPRPADADHPGTRGLYDDFGAYRTPTDADYHRLLIEGLVVPDTNVLLNLYRYNEQTRSDLLAILGKLSHLWVPHQVMAEFWRNRESVLQDPRDTAVNVRQLTTQRDQTASTIRAWANRVSLPKNRAAKLLKTLTDAFDGAISAVSDLADKQSTDFARDTNNDPVLAQLEPILQGRVGAPLGQDDYERAVKEAKARAESKRPPGYKDAGKTDGNAAGDYLVWCQILREARTVKRDVLLITGDVKEDWWRREQGEARGPRPELAQELRETASARLLMLRPESLLLRAGPALQIEVHDQSVQDAERVDRSLAEAETSRRLATAVSEAEVVRDAWPEVLEVVKKRRKIAWMLLSTATAEALWRDNLVVRFQKDGEAKGFISSGCDAILAEALDELFGVKLDITAVGPEWVSLSDPADASEPSSAEQDDPF